MRFLLPSQRTEVSSFIVKFLFGKTWLINLQLGSLKLCEFWQLFKLLENLQIKKDSILSPKLNWNTQSCIICLDQKANVLVTFLAAILLGGFSDHFVWEFYSKYYISCFCPPFWPFFF